jgi:hypothetical protein
LLGCSRRGKENLFMQVGGWIARYANVRDFLNSNPGSPQTVAHRLRGKTRTMLHAIKAFFLDRRHDASVFD